ncbi:MAG: hypothetical protein O9266_03335 [Porphyrobacter sp.]|nr:hypothetical protein [Porphyrobacter sp.]
MAGLGACASSDARYPSLAMRPFETAPPAAAPEPPAEPTRPLAGPAALAELAARAVAANEAFTSQQPAASRLARAAFGQPVESDARARALVAMADLAARRGATSAVLAELDRLAADSAITFAPAQEIEATRSRVLILVQGQDAAMARLWEEMGQ